jgi:hypothetical protein
MNRIKLNARVLIRNLRVQNVHGRPEPLPPTGARGDSTTIAAACREGRRMWRPGSSWRLNPNQRNMDA